MKKFLSYFPYNKKYKKWIIMNIRNIRNEYKNYKKRYKKGIIMIIRIIRDLYEKNKRNIIIKYNNNIIII